MGQGRTAFSFHARPDPSLHPPQCFKESLIYKMQKRPWTENPTERGSHALTENPQKRENEPNETHENRKSEEELIEK